MTKEYKYPGFFLRVVASLIDGILLDVGACAFVLLCLGVVFWVKTLLSLNDGNSGYFLSSYSGEGFSLGGVDPFLLQLVLVASRLILSFLYFGWGTFRYGTTLGKRCFRIYVVSRSTYSPLTLRQSLHRWLSYFVSYAVPIGGGFVFALFHSQKRALHDLMADTICIITPFGGELYGCVHEV
ncbi:MAG: RDD family protein [Bdellovibrionia bacterium]